MGAAIVMLLLPYGMAAIMPTWRWLVSYVGLTVVLLALWVHAVWGATGLFAGMALIWAGVIAVSTVCGALIRVATLAMEARGWHRGTGVVTIAGALIPFAVLAVSALAR